MAKIFIGQSVSGEDVDEVIGRTKKISKILEKKGHEPKYYISAVEDSKGTDNKDKVLNSFKKVEENDIFFAIVRSEKKSEGMLFEIGFCLLKGIRIFLAINKDVTNTYLRSLADDFFEFNDEEDLRNKLKEAEL